MSEVIPYQGEQWERLKALALDGVSSPHSRRAYSKALDGFLVWYQLEPRPGLTKATVTAYRAYLENLGLSSSTINVRLAAIRKLVSEAADNGLLAPETAAGIARVRGANAWSPHGQLAPAPAGASALAGPGYHHAQG